MAREKPLHEQMVQFVKYHLGKDCFAPFTGTDYPAWAAFVYLLQCFAHGGGDTAIAAMRQTIATVQHSGAVLRVFVQAIPGVMDWGDVARLWPRIAEGVQVIGWRERGDTSDARYLYAVERSEVYRGNSKHVEEIRTAHGLRNPDPKAGQLGATP